MMKISIIIVNYKVEEELLACINSIYKSKPKTEFEIIVVDNSEEGIIGKRLKKEYPKVKYLESKSNVGYGAGNNLGSKLATGEYLFILNPDTIFLNNVIDHLFNFINKNNKIGVVAPLLIDKNDNPYELQGTKELTPKRAIFSLSIFSKLFPGNKTLKDYWNIGWDKSKKREVDIVPGTAFLISKELFNKIGGFDEKFFLFFEEFDLCIQIRKLKYKNYIIPEAKLFHKWGSSTIQNENTNKYFDKSRFYYLNKNYGLLKAFSTEFFLRINKYNILLSFIVLLALFLRFYNLKETMPFIGDFGWFFLSAKDMIVSGQIPLVGITSSHTWLHQGAFWTYILGAILWITNFNSFIPAYFTSLLDVLTIILIYYLTKNLFNKKIALISALFYAASPLIIIHTQVPYHTSVIPFIAVLFLISVYVWVKGRAIFFPISLFLLAVLYNFEIATVTLDITLVFFLGISFIKKKKWALDLFRLKIIILSILGVVIPMIPMLIYDVSHGFPQTIKVVVWMGYRIALIFGYPELHPDVPAENWFTFKIFLFSIIQRFYFVKNQEIALLLFLIAFIFIFYKLIITKFKDVNLVIVFLFFTIPLIAYIAAKTNSEAYVLIFFPLAAIIMGYFFGSFKHKLMPISIAIVVLIVFFNSIWIIKVKNIGHTNINDRIEASRKIVKDANGRPFNIIGRGEWSQYESFMSTYKYFTWTLGNGPTVEDQKLKYYISEPFGNIVIEKK